ncbi:hypothetical protein ACW5XF_01200 [Aeromonas lusitana]|uniref:hypothetical protein n=1 Tax=Aeromonas lusitana TaxID=931529 RepID=UPI0012FE32A2|nr:hypothetical protein [Aeromonas lusitana]
MKELNTLEVDMVAGGWQAQGSSGNDARNSPAEGSGNHGRGNSGNGGNSNKGSGPWISGDSCLSTVVRDAGYGLMGGATGSIGHPAKMVSTILAGGVLGAMAGYSECNNHGVSSSSGSSGKNNRNNGNH